MKPYMKSLDLAKVVFFLDAWNERKMASWHFVFQIWLDSIYIYIHNKLFQSDYKLMLQEKWLSNFVEDGSLAYYVHCCLVPQPNLSLHVNRSFSSV